MILNRSGPAIGPEERATAHHLARRTNVPILGPVPHTSIEADSLVAFQNAAERAPIYGNVDHETGAGPRLL